MPRSARVSSSRPSLVVDVGAHAVVGVPGVADVLVGHVVQIPAVGVEQPAAHDVHLLDVDGGDRGHVDGVVVVEVPVAPRGDEGRMGMGEGHPQHERPVLVEPGQVVELLHARELHLLVVVDLQAAHAEPGIHHRPQVDAGRAVAFARDPVRRPCEVGGVDVGGDAFVEPVHLVGTDEVHLAAEHGVVVPVPQVVGEGGDRGRHLDGVVPHRDGVGVTARQHRHAGRHAEREVAVGVLEHRAVFGQPFEVRRPRHRMAVQGQRQGGHLVRLDDEEVGRLGGHWSLVREVFGRTAKVRPFPGTRLRPPCRVGTIPRAETGAGDCRRRPGHHRPATGWSSPASRSGP